MGENSSVSTSAAIKITTAGIRTHRAFLCIKQNVNSSAEPMLRRVTTGTLMETEKAEVKHSTVPNAPMAASRD